MEVRMFTVGQIQENTYIFRRDGSDRALIVDPGDEADRLLAAIDALGVKLDGILLTHTHFDHVGAVAPVARATGAEVWVPKIEAVVLADIMSYVPWPGFGPYESYDAEHTLEGGERLELAGFEIDVLFTPGHSPGHVTFSIPDEQAIFSGDVLFRQSDRPHRPAGRRLRHAARVDPDAGGHAPRGHRRLPGSHGHHDTGRGAGDKPVPGRAGEVKKLQAPRGTLDVLPPDGRRRIGLVTLTGEVLSRAGYEPIETPVFEDTEVFARGVGESTDIVQKEMFTFEDKAGRSLTLRPEATAGICRAYIEHGMHKLPQPVKVWEAGPFFRHEAPQAGRFRQFTQIDAEAIGSDDPSLDAELILLFDEILERAGTGPRRLRLSSLGTPETRAEYIEELKGFLRAREDELSEEVRSRLDQNPLRAFDADHPGTQAVMKEAPLLLDRLAPDDAEHLAEVRALLDAAELEYEIDPTLVRGLDYYTRTVFEVESERLGAQAALGGGGRYDGLIEELGGPPTPGVGWAAGVERILMAAGAAEEDHGIDVFVAGTGRDAFVLVGQLRSQRPARPDGAGRAVSEGPAEARRPSRCPLDGDSRRRDRGQGHGHGGPAAR